MIEQVGLSANGPGYSTPPQIGTVTGRAPVPSDPAAPNAPVVLTVAPGGVSVDPGRSARPQLRGPVVPVTRWL
jgi:hypothetical protein